MVNTSGGFGDLFSGLLLSSYAGEDKDDDGECEDETVTQKRRSNQPQVTVFPYQISSIVKAHHLVQVLPLLQGRMTTTNRN